MEITLTPEEHAIGDEVRDEMLAERDWWYEDGLDIAAAEFNRRFMERWWPICPRNPDNAKTQNAEPPDEGPADGGG